MRSVFSRRRVVLGTALVLVLGAGGFAGWMALVRAGVLRYNKWDRRETGTLRVGDLAPDLEIAGYDGSPLRLASLWAEKPAVLVFGSCT
jgi:hypothetical protein